MVELLLLGNPLLPESYRNRDTRSEEDDRQESSSHAFLLLLSFAYLGDAILAALQITLDSVMIAGGIFLLVFAVKHAMSHEYTPRSVRAFLPFPKFL